MLSFCNPYLNKTVLIAPARSFEVNNKDSFTRDNSQDFPPVIILSSVNDKVSKVEEKLVERKENCLKYYRMIPLLSVLFQKPNIKAIKLSSASFYSENMEIQEISLFIHLKRNRATDYL